MAFDAKPSTWLGAGYSLAANAITMNTATAGSDVTLPELTDAEANATTGDVRDVFFALAEAMYQAYNDTASADRPTKMRLYRSNTTNETTGIVTRSYTLQFDLAIGAIDVDDEPA